MRVSTWLVVGILVLAWVFIKVLPKLLVRMVGRFALKKVGEAAIANVPEEIRYVRASAPHWRDEATMQAQAGQLIEAGFNDQGTYHVDTMAGVLIRVLFQPLTYVTAQICEHPRGGRWTELATRYKDDSSDYLSTLPDQGVAAPPFARSSRADKNTPADHLYQQHLAQRKAGGIKAVAPGEAIHEIEDAYLRYMVWKNNKGLTAEEVAHVAAKWARAKGHAAGH